MRVLEHVKLSDARKRSFSDLSGDSDSGRSLPGRWCPTGLLLLDEPTANVDAVLETELFELLHRLNRKMTIVLVTHDLGFVSSYVKRWRA